MEEIFSTCFMMKYVAGDDIRQVFMNLFFRMLLFC